MNNCINLTLNDTEGFNHSNEPVWKNITGIVCAESHCFDVRIVNEGCNSDGYEIPRDIYETDNATWAYVVFEHNTTAVNIHNYSAYYNYSGATQPDYETNYYPSFGIDMDENYFNLTNRFLNLPSAKNDNRSNGSMAMSNFSFDFAGTGDWYNSPTAVDLVYASEPIVQNAYPTCLLHYDTAGGANGTFFCGWEQMTCMNSYNGSIVKEVQCNLSTGSGSPFWNSTTGTPDIIFNYTFRIYPNMPFVWINMTMEIYSGDAKFKRMSWMYDWAWVGIESSTPSYKYDYYWDYLNDNTTFEDHRTDTPWIFGPALPTNPAAEDIWFMQGMNEVGTNTTFVAMTDHTTQPATGHEGWAIDTKHGECEIGPDYTASSPFTMGGGLHTTEMYFGAYLGTNVTKPINLIKGLTRWPVNVTIGDKETQAAPSDINPGVIIQHPENITYNNNSVWFNITLNDTDTDICLLNLSGTNHSMTNSSGNWNYLNTTLLVNFSYLATFWCNDTSGNVNNTESVRFNLSFSEPVVFINLPTNDTYDVSNIRFEVVSSDSSFSIDTCVVGYNGTNHTMTNFSGSWWHINTSMLNGTYEATYYCNNTNGNLNDTESVFFTVAAEDPDLTFSIISPINITYYNNETILLNVTSTVNLSWVGYSLNGGRNITISDENGTATNTSGAIVFTQTGAWVNFPGGKWSLTSPNKASIINGSFGFRPGYYYVFINTLQGSSGTLGVAMNVTINNVSTIMGTLGPNTVRIWENFGLVYLDSYNTISAAAHPSSVGGWGIGNISILSATVSPLTILAGSGFNTLEVFGLGSSYNDSVNFSLEYKCNSSFVNGTTCGGYGVDYILTCRQIGFKTYQFDVENMTYCEFGCRSGACNSEEYFCSNTCLQNDTICDSNYVINCNQLDSGCWGWNLTNRTRCQYGCFGGFCTPCEDVCNFGASKCVQNMVVFCDDDNNDGCYEWSASNRTLCQYACESMVSGTSTNASCGNSYDKFFAEGIKAFSDGIGKSITIAVAPDSGDLPNRASTFFILFTSLILGVIAAIKMKRGESEANWKFGFFVVLGVLFLGMAIAWLPVYIFVLFLIIGGFIFIMKDKNES